MYVTVKTRGELDDDQFQEIFALIDNAFEVTKVLTFSEEGDKIETVAVMDYIDEDPYGAEYEFDVSRRIGVEEGNALMQELGEILKYDFELDAPISKDDYNED